MTRDRYAQCDDTCTVDCGACKGAGRPVTAPTAVTERPGGDRLPDQPPMTADEPTTAQFHRAENAEERGEGICRTCLAPVWNEGGTVGHVKRAEGWSDRIERGGDSLVCFKAIEYRHVPLTGREAAIYDRAYMRGREAS